MMKQHIYRVVIVQNGEIIWAGYKFFVTKSGAIADIEQRVAEYGGLCDYKSEKYTLHSWDTFEMREGATLTWLTVHMITSVINEQQKRKAIFGIVEYDLD